MLLVSTIYYDGNYFSYCIKRRDVLKLRPGITRPATLKYRLEDEMIAEFLDVFMNANYPQIKMSVGYFLKKLVIFHRNLYVFSANSHF